MALTNIQGCGISKKLHDYLESIRFKRLQVEPNLFIRKEGKTFVILGVYADNLHVVSRSTHTTKRVIIQLKNKLPMKVLGPLEFCLAIKVSRNRTVGTLTLS